MEATTWQQREDAYQAALETNDTQLVAAFLAPGWRLLEPAYGLIDRERFLAGIGAGRLSHARMAKEVIHVAEGDDWATVISHGRNVGKLNGEPFDAEVYVTNVWQLVADGNWQIAFSGEAPVRCPA